MGLWAPHIRMLMVFGPYDPIICALGTSGIINFQTYCCDEGVIRYELVASRLYPPSRGAPGLTFGGVHSFGFRVLGAFRCMF